MYLKYTRTPNARLYHFYIIIVNFCYINIYKLFKWFLTLIINLLNEFLAYKKWQSKDIYIQYQLDDAIEKTSNIILNIKNNIRSQKKKKKKNSLRDNSLLQISHLK